MSIAASSAPRPGPRPSTSREEIVRIAIRLLDRDGPDALTFRGVARELGVTVGALARYFKNLADLRDAVAAEILAKVRPLDPKGKRALPAQLVRLGMDWLDVNRAHPYLLDVRGPLSAVPVARHVARNLATIVAAGVDVERALVVYSVLTNLAMAWGVQLARREDPARQAALMRVMAEEAPELVAQIAKLESIHGPGFHRRTFERLVVGLLG